MLYNNSLEALHAGVCCSLTAVGCRILQEVDELQPGKTLLHELGEGGMEQYIVCISKSERSLLCAGLVYVALVALVQGTKVAPDGELTIHDRELGAEVRFVEVIDMLHVNTAQT